MRNPNGYGGVNKLSGNRRNPWRARVTVGNAGGRQKYKAIGYYPTREEALIALAEYNKHPYDLDKRCTFADVYEQWSKIKYATISHPSVYIASYKVCEPLHNMVFADLRLSHLQALIDNCGKNYPTLGKVSVLFNQLYDYAMKHDICEKNYAEFVELAHHRRHIESKHVRFTSAEIEHLWANIDCDEYASVVAMLIYSGVRVSELLELKKSNVHLDERWFEITKSKTEAGLRVVPIAAKTLPYFEYWMSKDGEYLIADKRGLGMEYQTFARNHWKSVMKKLGMSHLPHDTRYTTVSLLAEQNINPTIIKRIVGHAGAMSLTERVYTHFEVQELIDAIDAV